LAISEGKISFVISYSHATYSQTTNHIEHCQASKRARIDESVKFGDSESISKKILDFSVSSGAFTGDSGVSLSYDRDQDAMGGTSEHKRSFTPPLPFDPALQAHTVAGACNSFSLDDLIWGSDEETGKEADDGQSNDK
jgi:hypothetical protein